MIELLCVIVVLGALATIVVMSVGGTTDRAGEAASGTDRSVLSTALEAYHAQHGAYASESGLVEAGLLRAASTTWDVVLDEAGDNYTLVEAIPSISTTAAATSTTTAPATTAPPTTASPTTAPATTAPVTTAPPTTAPPTTAPPTTAPADGGVTCSFVIDVAWDAAGNGTLSIENGSAAPIIRWTVRIAHGGRTIDLWNATNVVTDSKYLTADNWSWNGTVAAGATTALTGGSVSGAGLTAGQSFGCTVVPATVADIGDVACSFVVDSVWDTGGNGSLSITNNSKIGLAGWTVEIATNPSRSISLWNATTTELKKSVTATNLPWNGAVAAGATVTPTSGLVSGKGVHKGDSFECTVVATG